MISEYSAYFVALGVVFVMLTTIATTFIYAAGFFGFGMVFIGTGLYTKKKAKK